MAASGWLEPSARPSFGTGENPCEDESLRRRGHLAALEGSESGDGLALALAGVVERETDSHAYTKSR